MRNRLAFLWVLLGLLGALFAYGCGAGSSATKGEGGSGGDTGGTSSSGTAGQGQGGCFINCSSSGSGGGQQQGTLIISPANPALQVVDGNIPTQDFTVTLNGSDVTANVVWSYERPDIGDMTGAKFQPTGLVAGIGTLTAKYSQAEGTTTVTVSIVKTVNGAGVTPQQQQQFDTPSGPDPSMAIVYPYNETVFPLGVLAPDIQWNNVQGGEIYRLKIKEKYYEYTEYFTTSSPAHHLVAEADWANISSSGTGAQSDPVSVQLSRMVGGVAYQSVNQVWHVAQGRLKGSVYYWELPDACGAGNGRILRIKPDSPNVDEFFQPGVCWGCHTVSRDGKKLAAEFNDGNGPLYTLDLAANPVAYGDVKPGNPAGNFIFSAFNHDGTKLLASDNTASSPPAATLKIVDAITAQTLNPNAMGSGCGEPAWSPDGTKVAGICNMTGGGWTFDASGGNLAVADVAPDGFTVSNVTTIVPQAGGQGRPAYPSFAPGSEYIAFGRPTYGSRSIDFGDLWLVKNDGSELKKLQTASSDNKSFNPVFAPLRAGGYFWLVFITRRDYGNQLVGASRQQLWITAIDDPPTAADPSHPPFYLRGQEMCGKSENAYYALDPCKEVGASCVSGPDCCNGQCVKDPNTNQYVCGEPPPPGQCSADGNSCVTAADCCNSDSDCVDGFCTPPIPK